VSIDISAGPAAADLPPEAVLQLSEVFKPRSTFRFDVACVGLGYVGLPTALAFHAARSRVLGFDACAERLAVIAAKRVDLLDSDQARLDHALGGDAFTLTDDPGLLAEAQAVIIAVPTPVDEYQLPDLAILRSACASVVANAVLGQIIILTSTSYVGSTQEMLVAPLAARGFTIGEDIHVAFSPERIDPGNDRHAHEDVARVVGGATPECARAAMAVLGAYAVNLHAVSSTKVAEMTKLFENTFRAVNIALANELAEISRAFQIDVAEVITAAATKPFGFMAFMPLAAQPPVSSSQRPESVTELCTWLEKYPPRADAPGHGYLRRKRLTDLTLLLLLSPLWLTLLGLVALLVFAGSWGDPVLFRQHRTGKGLRRFVMFKFRTMVPNAEELKAQLQHLNLRTWPDFKVDPDPRVTRLGGFLRRTSLDELPQLINVLRGDMALVGPRPTTLPPDAYEPWQLARFNGPSGVTGLWQIAGRGRPSFVERVHLDLAYLERACWRLDAEILIRTLPQLLLRRGA